MNMDNALKIFALGVKYGHKHANLGLNIDKSSDDYLSQFLFEGFKENRTEIEAHAKMLEIKKGAALFYAQYWTTKQAFRFGLITGFELWPQVKEDKRGRKELTEDVIDQLTQKQFKNVTNE